MKPCLCDSCIHRDEVLEYTRGGVVMDAVCLMGCAQFGRVERVEQCKSYKDENSGSA